MNYATLAIFTHFKGILANFECFNLYFSAPFWNPPWRHGWADPPPLVTVGPTLPPPDWTYFMDDPFEPLLLHFILEDNLDVTVRLTFALPCQACVMVETASPFQTKSILWMTFFHVKSKICNLLKYNLYFSNLQTLDFKNHTTVIHHKIFGSSKMQKIDAYQKLMSYRHYCFIGPVCARRCYFNFLP